MIKERYDDVADNNDLHIIEFYDAIQRRGSTR